MKIGGYNTQFHFMTIYKSFEIRFTNPGLRNPPLGGVFKDGRHHFCNRQPVTADRQFLVIVVSVQILCGIIICHHLWSILYNYAQFYSNLTKSHKVSWNLIWETLMRIYNIYIAKHLQCVGNAYYSVVVQYHHNISQLQPTANLVLLIILKSHRISRSVTKSH